MNSPNDLTVRSLLPSRSSGAGRKPVTALGLRRVPVGVVGSCAVRLVQRSRDIDLPGGGAERLLERLARRRGSPPVVLCTARPRVARIVRRYHVAASSELALEAIADEVERVIAESRRPRLSRLSDTANSRPSIS
jgi:hypothetical protein